MPHSQPSASHHQDPICGASLLNLSLFPGSHEHTFVNLGSGSNGLVHDDPNLHVMSCFFAQQMTTMPKLVPKFVENWSHAVSNAGFIQPVERYCILLALLKHADHTQVNKLN